MKTPFKKSLYAAIALAALLAGSAQSSADTTADEASTCRPPAFRIFSPDSVQPLYIVDGVPLAGGIDRVNPRDVASIAVLKDSTAYSLYGRLAVNGAVIITTKNFKGNTEKRVFKYNTSWEKAVKKHNALRTNE